MYDAGLVSGAAVELMRRGVTVLPPDVERALRAAFRREKGVAREQLRAVLRNVALAKGSGRPLCQDTGVPIFFVWCRSYTKEIERGLIDGVGEATRSVPLRPSVVHPLTRKGGGENFGQGVPEIHWRPSDSDDLEIVYMPKGAGSENTSRYYNLPPTDPERALREAVLETVVCAGGGPCPPTIIGVGVGSTMSRAGLLAKKSHIRLVGQRSRDPVIARLERGILRDVNSLGIGPMGLGGRTTALDVHVEYAACHTASLPVAINLQCWAARRSSVRLSPEGGVEYGFGRLGKDE